MSGKRASEAERKRILLPVGVRRLHLDPDNPRLPSESQRGKDEDLLRVLYKKFDLDELADSMANNGYFDEEPLVGIPIGLPRRFGKREYEDYIRRDTTEFTVVEGNRRLAAVKLLLDDELRQAVGCRHWPNVSEPIRKDLGELPIVIYRTRNEVVPYLGVRHILGIQKWDIYARATYIAKMVEGGRSIEDIQAQIGDRRDSARKTYICFQILQQVEGEFGFDLKAATADFSLLMLAIGQGPIKRFLGLPTRPRDVNLSCPVPKQRLHSLKDLFTWLFGNGTQKKVIRESRDITRYLSPVVDSPEALEYLRDTGYLEDAYDRSAGEEAMLRKYLAQANRKLEAAMGIAHRHRTADVIADVQKCSDTVKQLLKLVKDQA